MRKKKERDEAKKRSNQGKKKRRSAIVLYQITDEERKRGMPLVSCGPAIVELAQYLLSLKKLEESTFKEIIKAVGNHYSPKPIEMTSHIVFHQQNQQGRETAVEFLA